MPCLKIITNISKNAIPKDFVHKMIPVLSRTVKKAENKFLVVVTPDVLLTFGGTNELGVIATLESIGHLGPKENQIISKEVTDLIVKELGVPKEQVFLTFYDLTPYNVAKNGATREGFD